MSRVRNPELEESCRPVANREPSDQRLAEFTSIRQSLEARALAWAGGLNTYSRPSKGPTATLRKWTDHRALADSLLSIPQRELCILLPVGHDLFISEGGYGCFIYLGAGPTWSPSWVTFMRIGHVIKEADGPAYRRVVRGPFASPDTALSACTAFLFDAVKSGTTGL